MKSLRRLRILRWLLFFWISFPVFMETSRSVEFYISRYWHALPMKKVIQLHMWKRAWPRKLIRPLTITWSILYLMNFSSKKFKWMTYYHHEVKRPLGRPKLTRRKESNNDWGSKDNLHLVVRFARVLAIIKDYTFRYKTTEKCKK